MAKTPADVMKMARDAGVKIVDFRFTDLLGTWQHTSKSIADVDEDVFEDGVGFDGSSIRGFQAINESDMLMMPDPETAQIDPYTQIPTMYVLCDIYDPRNGSRYSRDPRGVAQRAEAYLKSTGLGDTAYFGPEPEFFVFDNVHTPPPTSRRFTPSIPSKASGTPAVTRGRTSATRFDQKPATTRFRPMTP